jgi:hypothetical protein
MSTPGRVELKLSDTGGAGQSSLSVQIATGGQGAPLITLADNNGFPSVAELYARAGTYPSGIAGTPRGCINVYIRFESNISATGTELLPSGCRGV